MVKGQDGEFMFVHNVGGFDLVFKNENTSSSEANRFALNSDLTLKTKQSTLFWYDSTSTRWRAIQGGGGVGWPLSGTGALTGNVEITGSSTHSVSIGAAASYLVDFSVYAENQLLLSVSDGTSFSDYTITPNSIVVEVSDGTETTTWTMSSGTLLWSLGEDAFMQVSTQHATNNDVAKVLHLQRAYNGGAGANNIGARIQVDVESATNGSYVPMYIDHVLTNATLASADSRIDISGFSVGSLHRLLSIDKDATLILGGVSLGGNTRVIGVDGSGSGIQLVVRPKGDYFTIGSTLGLQLGESSNTGNTRSITAVGSGTDIDIILAPKASASVRIEASGSTGSISLVHTSAASFIRGGNSTLPFDVAGVTQSTKGANLRLFGGSGSGSGDNGGDVFISGGPSGGGSGVKGNIGINAYSLSNWQSMVGGVFIADVTTAPGGNPSGGGFFYVESGALKYRGSSGTVTTIAPA
jgi:hypothetical protein